MTHHNKEHLLVLVASSLLLARRSSSTKSVDCQIPWTILLESGVYKPKTNKKKVFVVVLFVIDDVAL